MDVRNAPPEKMAGLEYTEVQDFLSSLYAEPESTLFQKMKEEAKEKFIPIMDERVEPFVRLFLRQLKPQRILELGSGIGYSALVMADSLPDLEEIHSYEINSERYEQAKAYVQASPYQDKIHFYLDDFKKILETKDPNILSEIAHYDLIYIDAAKGQYDLLLDQFLKYGKTGVVLIFDNIFINGWVVNLKYPNHRRKTYVLKMRAFLEKLKERFNIEYTIIPLSDGMVVIEKVDGGN